MEEENTTINDLNDDCLECIFEHIQDLPNQIQIAKCCQRFRDIMIGLWTRQSHRRVLAFNVLSTTLVNYGDLRYYLTAMRTEFHTLQIIDDCLNVFLKEMEDCGIQCFPCVERCEFHDDITDCYPCDKDVDALSKLVPNLKYLQITVPITGKHLINFQNLEELHLYGEQTKDKEIETEVLRQILLNLQHLRVLDLRTFEMSSLRLVPEISQCSRLEVLKLNLSTLKPMVNQVLELPQLKQLKVLLDTQYDLSMVDNIDNYDYKIYDTQEYHQIIRQKGAQIQGIAVDFDFLPVSSTWLNDFGYLEPANLKLLALCNNQFNANEYDKCQFSRLEMLCLRHSHNLQRSDILEMLHLCPVLKHLDISYCLNLDTSLLRDISNYLQKEKRNHVLRIYYRMSGLETEIEKVSARSYIVCEANTL